MAKRSYKPEEIVSKLRQVDVLHSQGVTISDSPLRVKTRRAGASPGRSAPGGEADEIGGGHECGNLNLDEYTLARHQTSPRSNRS